MKFNKYNRLASMAALLAATAISVSSCKDNEYPDPIPEAIYPGEVEMILPAEAEALVYLDEYGERTLPMLAGENVTLSGSVVPHDLERQELTWLSSVPEVATVDANGTVTAVSGSAGSGFTMISVAPNPYYSASGIAVSLKVRVSDQLVPVTDISVVSDADGLFAGDELQLSVNALPADATYRTYRWTSSDPSVATVDDHGVVTGMVNSQVEAEVTITATAIDGSGVSGSKVLTVTQVVEPQDVTIDQTYSKANGHVFAYTDRRVVLEYTTVPAVSTFSHIVWESSDPEVMTVENGVVSFNQSGNFGEATITATCPETGKSSSITLECPAGFYRALFQDENDWIWWPGDGKDNVDWVPGCITVKVEGGDKLRRDIRAQEVTYLHAGNYPVFAVKMDDVKDNEGVTSRNITLDASGSCGGSNFSGGLNGNNNKWLHDYKCSDGSHVFIYSLTEQGFANGGKLPTDAVASFRTWQFKYADIKGPNPQFYRMFWVQTFKTQADVDKYLREVDNVTWEVLK